MFFSEEKNQKTFMPFACIKVPIMANHGWTHPESKSLLVLFFRKELLPSS
jgi:hypothetical protein